MNFVVLMKLANHLERPDLASASRRMQEISFDPKDLHAVTRAGAVANRPSQYSS
jgi:hypothetical protein